MVRLVVVIACLSTVGAQKCESGGKEYNTCDGVAHVMCQFKLEQNTEGACNDMRLNEFAESDKAWIVAAHNCMRDRLASGTVEGAPEGWPQAANMQLMSWDDELATFARRWAFQCRTGGDKCRASSTYGVCVEQSVEFANGKTIPDYKAVLTDWFNTFLRAVKADVGNYTAGNSATKFFRMMWADAHKVGCAFVSNLWKGPERCKRPKGAEKEVCDETWKGFKFVCNYAPASLMTGAAAWAIGAPCSQCNKPNEASSLSDPHRYESAKCVEESTYPNLCSDRTDPSKEPCIGLPLGGSLRQSQAGSVLLAVAALASALD